MDAADDAFVQGIRVALTIGAVLTLITLIAGFVIFPRGTSDERAEDVEAARLAVEEDPAG